MVSDQPPALPDTVFKQLKGISEFLGGTIGPVFVRLWGADGPMSQAQLEAATAQPPEAVARELGSLVEQRLVKLLPTVPPTYSMY